MDTEQLKRGVDEHLESAHLYTRINPRMTEFHIKHAQQLLMGVEE